jgi:hypothetical protein
MSDELAFKVVRPHDHDYDEVLARAVNLLIARGAYRAAARMYPENLIGLRQGARVTGVGPAFDRDQNTPPLRERRTQPLSRYDLISGWTKRLMPLSSSGSNSGPALAASAATTFALALFPYAANVPFTSVTVCRTKSNVLSPIPAALVACLPIRVTLAYTALARRLFGLRFAN